MPSKAKAKSAYLRGLSSSARADILNAYETAAAQPAAVARQLGRLVKHRLQK